MPYAIAALLVLVSCRVSAADFSGAQLGAGWAIPFAGILLSIALCPLLVPSFWHHHFGKVAAGWSLAFLVPFALTYGHHPRHPSSCTHTHPRIHPVHPSPVRSLHGSWWHLHSRKSPGHSHGEHNSSCDWNSTRQLDGYDRRCDAYTDQSSGRMTIESTMFM